MSHTQCVWFVMLLFMLAACPADGRKDEAAPAAQTQEGPMIEYTAPFRRIVLSPDLHLSDTEETAVYDNPVSAVPSSMTKAEKTAQVSEEDVLELLKFIRESGFGALKDAYGAGPDERSYPHRILVQDGKEKKEVLCRSSPTAEACPAVFTAVEKRIIEFAQKAVQTKTGE